MSLKPCSTRRAFTALKTGRPGPVVVEIPNDVAVEEFDALAAQARRLGFKQVVAGPFVRSSYHADEMVPGHAHADHPA